MFFSNFCMSLSKFFVSSLLALVVSAGAAAQRPVVKAELDSVAIFVGGQVGLNVSVQMPKGEEARLLPLPDTLTSHVEVVEMVRADTTLRGDLVECSFRYLLTSFDTGLQYVPPIPFLLAADSTVVSMPDFALSVVNPFQKILVDEQSGVACIFDIRDAIDAPFQWSELLLYWPWLLVAAAVAGLIVLVLWLRRRHARRGGEVGAASRMPLEPCEVTALRDLERIRGQKLWMHNKVKEFYSDLTDTLRRYVASRFGVQAMESTSSQLMEMLRGPLKGSPGEAEALSRILELADFAKFAKVEPLPDENDRALTDAVNFVNATTDAARRAQEQVEKKEE